jgi:hypothetical protein
MPSPRRLSSVMWTWNRLAVHFEQKRGDCEKKDAGKGVFSQVSDAFSQSPAVIDDPHSEATETVHQGDQSIE